MGVEPAHFAPTGAGSFRSKPVTYKHLPPLERNGCLEGTKYKAPSTKSKDRLSIPTISAKPPTLPTEQKPVRL
jgi:hypothetical protein